jgi:glutamate dehydrogenase (NADP+)
MFIKRASSSLTKQEVDQRLHIIMGDIHQTCKIHGQKGDRINYLQGANIGGFVKVADAMLAQGVV